MRRYPPCSRTLLILCGFLILLAVPGCAFGEAASAAVAAYDAYVGRVEARLAQQHQAVNGFLVLKGTDEARLRNGESIAERLTPKDEPEMPGAMLHHWRATAFVPGATVADLERLKGDYGAYSRIYAPQVVWANVLSGQRDHLQMEMRVRQKHVITVVMDSAYDVEVGRLDANHGYSAARSTKISEIDSPGTKNEHVLSASEEHGFLWRQNTYWSYEERDGGLYMQIESVSLSRAIPRGLAWAVGPFVESVPRESLEFTLRSTCNAFGKQ
jgi:hypothetical protein